jgi:hypothetical protein
MSERPLEFDAEDAAASYQHALLSLHAHAGTYGDKKPADVPGFAPRPPQDALAALARASTRDVSVSARLDLLYRLVPQGLADDPTTQPGYEQLAASVLPGRDLELSQLLSDLRTSAQSGTPFADTVSGRHFEHHETAFIGQQVCRVQTVRVNGIESTWIYAEIETDADFRDLASWVDPHKWSSWGPSFFTKMEFVGEPDPATLATPPGDDHWHGVFHEQVQLLRRLNTLLRCAYWRQADRAVGMTYDLDLSLDGEIDVDRGYLLVTALEGGMKRVKALKVVGFTRPEWDALAQFVCPVWTDLVRQAVAGATTSRVTPPTQGPPSSSPLVDTFEAWVDFLGASASTYLGLFEGTSDRLRARRYSSADLLDDGRRYWSQLAKDWARAWAHGMDTLNEVAEHGVDAGFTPPGVPHEVGRGAVSALTTPTTDEPPARPASATPSAAAGNTPGAVPSAAPRVAGQERSFVPVPALTPADAPTVSDLVSIEAGGAVLAAAEITVTVHTEEGGTPSVRLHTTNTSAPAGLYVGTLLGPPGVAGTSVQLYVARATEA